jgi:ribosomal protein S18 acetylase RimI-like enzyme
MLWRVRTTLPDRPGALALLAEQCGLADVNILGLQIFPGVEAVTDELVLRTPDDWEPAQIGRLVETAGGRDVVAMPCTEDALADQATLYVQAARAVLERPMTFPDVVGRLFDARLESVDGTPAGDDVMEMTVGDVEVQVRRSTAFTATEHARGAAMAALVTDVLARAASPGIRGEASGRRVGSGAPPAYAVEGDSVAARIDDVVVGRGTLGATDEPGVLAIGLGVDPAWQRRGIGSRLLVETARLALAKGADEIMLTTRSDNQAALPMVLAAGLRGRIRMAGDRLTVRIPVRDLKSPRA